MQRLSGRLQKAAALSPSLRVQVFSLSSLIRVHQKSSQQCKHPLATMFFPCLCCKSHKSAIFVQTQNSSFNAELKLLSLQSCP